MIDSVGYIIVTIELPSPRAFASILHIYRRAPGSDALVGPPNSPAPSLEGNGWCGARWEFTLGRKRLATFSSDDILARQRFATGDFQAIAGPPPLQHFRFAKAHPESISSV